MSADTRWNGPSGLSVERLAEAGRHSGSSYSVSVGAGDDYLLLTPEQWTDLIAAASELGEPFGAMP